jgi:hypothetical protein
VAVLDATNRARIIAQWMRDQTESLVGVTKADLRAAVDATDSWIDSNQTSFNNALPAAAKTNLSLTQKTLLFCYVAMRRAGRLRAEEDG